MVSIKNDLSKNDDMESYELGGTLLDKKKWPLFLYLG